MSPDPERLIGKTVGQYNIVRMLGKGGMATVYEGRHVSINRRVAVKVMPGSFLHDDTFMERFHQEAEVIAHLEHFHILPMYDYGQYEGRPFIIMRFMEGGTLDDMINEKGPLPYDDIIRIISQVAQALDYAHKRDVIHRDIKPSNVMLDAEGNAYLSDFGIARVLEGTSKLTGSGIVGTPAYMAPEQSEPGIPSPTMDIYALGVMLYEMITGQLPYIAETPIAQILMHIQRPVPSLRDVNPEIPEEVDEVLQKAMAKQPENRYSSATDLARALEAAVSSSEGWDWSPQTLAALKSIAELRTIRDGNDIFQEALRGSQPIPATDTSPRRPIPARTRQRKTRKLINIGIILSIIVILAVVAIGGFLLFGEDLGLVAPPPTPTVVEAEVIPTQTRGVAATFTPFLTPTPTAKPEESAPAEEEVTEEPPTATPAVTPTDLPPTITQHGATLVLIPAGEFIMGRDDGRPNERPPREVYLDAFYIDRYEVTNVYWMACVDAGACKAPEYPHSPSQVFYYDPDNTYYHDYPYINVTWYEAQAFCEWRGGHLPTEAQWEKAARWDPETGESRIFPWPGLLLDESYLNYDSLYGHTQPVGSYPSGVSPNGVYDMAGNLAEWVYDWYQDNYYEVGPDENPTGPETGEFKIFRGGSYESQGDALKTTFRDWLSPDVYQPTLGFRCAYTPSGDPTE